MDIEFASEELSAVQMKKLLVFRKKKKVEAFQKALIEYRDTIGDWDLTDFQDAGTEWRETSTLKCDCGKTLRYQYTVINRVTAEKHNFGINHLQAHTGFSDNAIRGIQKNLNVADREVDDMEQRLKENWSLNIQIPKSLELPDEIKNTLDEGLPLSKREEERLIMLVMEAQREKLKRSKLSLETIDKEYEKQPVNLFGELDSTNEVKRNHPFDLTESEKVFMNRALESGISSLMVIAEELHNVGSYKGRYLTGRPKYYPLCALYLDQLVRKRRVVLRQQFGLQDRMYELIEEGVYL